MSEFENRIDAQRAVLRVVNMLKGEALCGLSLNALQRWARVNCVARDSVLYLLLVEVSGKLFFLANKSQEQITEEYSVVVEDVQRILKEIEKIVYAR